MSERTASKTRIVQVGMGPGGAAFWLAAERMGKLDELKAAELVVLEKDPDSEVGVGYLRKFPGVKTNSAGGDLIANLSPEVQAALSKTIAGQKVKSQESAAIPLSDAVALQREKGKIVRATLGDSIITGVEVSSIYRVQNHGGPEYWPVDQYGRFVAKSDIVILSTGAEERLDPQLKTEELKNKSFLSGDFLGDGPNVRENKKRLEESKRVVVVGASHSGGLAARLALGISDAQVKLLTRGEVAIHSKSEDDAKASGLNVTPEAVADDPEGKQPWRFKGARGDARDTLIQIIQGQEPRATIHQGSYDDFGKELHEADLIIQCTGLKFRDVPIYSLDNFLEPVGYQKSRGRVVVNSEGNPYMKNEQGLFEPERQIFVVGMGTNESQHAINFYEGSVGEARVNAVLAASTRINSARQIIVGS